LTFLSTFSTDSIVHLSWSTIRHSFRTSNSPKELVLQNYFRNINHKVTYKFIPPQLNRTIMNKRKRLTKTKAQQRFHCSMWVGVLDVTRLLFLTAFSYTGYPRLLQKSQTPIRPFTLQVSRFTASNRILNDLTRLILIPRLDVPFLLRSQGSHPTPLQALQFSMVGGVSSDANWHPKPSASSPTHKNNISRSWR